MNLNFDSLSELEFAYQGPGVGVVLEVAVAVAVAVALVLGVGVGELVGVADALVAEGDGVAAVCWTKSVICVFGGTVLPCAGN